MIEMLGVLAIIGVLTVGSITGYSHAMRRHLLNKQREQISTILSTIETQYGALSASMPDLPVDPLRTFLNLGWIPEEMIRENNTTAIYDVFKNRAIFWISRNTTRTQFGFYIYLTNGNAFEQCVNLYQVAMSFHSSLWSLVIHHDDGYTGTKKGDINCLVNNHSCLRHSTPSDIAEICQKCKDNNRCNIYYTWHF